MATNKKIANLEKEIILLENRYCDTTKFSEKNRIKKRIYSLESVLHKLRYGGC